MKLRTPAASGSVATLVRSIRPISESSTIARPAGANAVDGAALKLKPGKYCARAVELSTSALQYWIDSCATATGCADTNVSIVSTFGSDCLMFA